MTVDTAKLYATNDAKVWAEAFMAEFGGRKDDIDEGLMIGWFANAIVTAEDLLRRSLPPEAQRAAGALFDDSEEDD